MKKELIIPDKKLPPGHLGTQNTYIIEFSNILYIYIYTRSLPERNKTWKNEMDQKGQLAPKSLGGSFNIDMPHPLRAPRPRPPGAHKAPSILSLEPSSKQGGRWSKEPRELDEKHLGINFPQIPSRTESKYGQHKHLRHKTPLASPLHLLFRHV